MITVDSVRLKYCSEMPSCGTTPYSKKSSEMPSCGTTPYSKNSTVIPILVMHKSLHKGIKIQNVQLNRIDMKISN